MVGRTGFSRREALFAGIGSAALAARPAWAFQGAAAADPVDAIVTGFLREFEIPGVSVALIRPGQPVFTRGYGVRALGSRARVDEDTLFAIASNTKAMLGAAMAMLVDEGKLAWDEPVTRYLPEFKMSDPHATAMTTVRDLLVHRSGLALGAGDLMIFPESTHTARDVLNGLQYLPLARGFRTGYAYDNILYLVAGLLIERVTGQKWDEVLTARVLRPLGMPNAVANRPLVRTANVAGRHARLGPPLRGFGPMERIQADESPVFGPAAGVHAGARDIVPWLQAQLGKGALPNGRRVWSEAQTREMWAPQVITASGPGATPELPTRSVLTGYGLGWFVQDYRGRRLLHHSGGLSGQVTYTGFFPESGHAFAVFTNTEDAPVGGLRNAVVDHLIGAPAYDWVASTRTRIDRQRNEALTSAGGDFNRAPPGGPSLPLAAYAGRYRDPWYGDIVVTQRGGGLHVDFTRTPVFKSALEPFGPDTYRTRWARGAGEDAVITFVVENGAVTRLRLKALSPFADFSYDFHDLNPVRVQ
jgi:CubicO group peptidase (beta-lactamase class C family)